MRIVPSAEQVASRRPKCLGANLMSVMDERPSTRRARFSHVDVGFGNDSDACDVWMADACCAAGVRMGEAGGLDTFSSQMATERS